MLLDLILTTAINAEVKPRVQISHDGCRNNYPNVMSINSGKGRRPT
jgi:hypothetical protein